MKSVFNYILISGILMLLLTSCYSPKFMVDDDVYLIKPNTLPLGESPNDETTYTNYKSHRYSKNTRYYDNSDELMFRHGFYHPHFWYNGFNYYNYSCFGTYRPDYWGYNYYGNYYGYCSPYYSYGLDPFYYDYYGYYGYPYGYYGYPYGYGGNVNNLGGQTIAYNHYSGPRGTLGGFGNPSGRLTGNTYKSMNQNIVPGKSIIERPVNQRKIDDSGVVGQGREFRSRGIQTSERPATRPAVNYRPTEQRVIHPSGGGGRNDGNIRPSRPSNNNPGRNIEFRGGGRSESPGLRNDGGGSNSGSGSGSGRSGSTPENKGPRRN